MTGSEINYLEAESLLQLHRCNACMICMYSDDDQILSSSTAILPNTVYLALWPAVLLRCRVFVKRLQLDSMGGRAHCLSSLNAGIHSAAGATRSLDASCGELELYGYLMTIKANFLLCFLPALPSNEHPSTLSSLSFALFPAQRQDKMEVPFTELEKRFVVAEAIKASDIPLQKLLEVLQYGGVQPQWSEMLLPLGRNLRSCIDAYDELIRSSAKPFTEPTASSKRKPSDLLDTLTDSSRKRRPPGLETIAAARNIQPKPAANGSHFSSFPTSVPKKRGRPSKADIEARQTEAAARGDLLPELKPKGGRISTGVPEIGEQTTIAPMTAAFQESKPEQSAESPFDREGSDNSGKKKRRRPSSSKSKVAPTGEGSFGYASPFPLEETNKQAEATMDVAIPDEATVNYQAPSGGGETEELESQRSNI